MSRETFIKRLLWLLPALLAVAMLLRILAGAQAFRIYGFAAAVLLLLPLATRTLSLRLAAVGASPRRKLLFALPIGLLAAGHILFWLVFFSGDLNTAVMLGSARSMALTLVPFALPLLYAVVVVLAAWPILTALRSSPRHD